MISGGTHDEERFFVFFQFDATGNPLTAAQYPDSVAAFIGLPTSDPFIQFLVNFEYPLSNYPAPAPPLALSALETDVTFACPERNSVQFLSQNVPTYAYEFNDENSPALFANGSSFPLGAYHGSELQYLFNSTPSAAFSADQHALSDSMISYWTTFAANGDPNSAGQPVWSPYDPGADEFQSLVPPTPMVESTFDGDHKCSSFWNTF